MYLGGFGSKFSWQNTLTRAAPLILTALCTALPARLGLIVIGAKGSLVLGGLAAAGAGLLLQSFNPCAIQVGMVAAGDDRRRIVHLCERCPAILARRERHDFQPAAGLHRDLCLRLSRRRADARPGEPQQAVDLSDSRIGLAGSICSA